MKWEKKDIAAELVKETAEKFGCDLLTASILARRGLHRGEAAMYIFEDDVRRLRNPFTLPGMEDAVERILAAKEEGEKVLIFGDSDVDGITGTVLLTRYLQSLDMDVAWRIPQGDEPYGLSMEAVDEFAAAYGTLIITVDCGISRNAEIQRANELSVDVIVTDHHEPQGELPQAYCIINPKMKDSKYGFRDLSGCGVAFKLVSALRFAMNNELYNQPICLLNTRPVNDAWVIEIAKMRNLAVIDTLSETIVPGMVGISDTRLPSFLASQQILVWDAPLQKRALNKLFGKSVEIGMLDLAPEIGKAIPQTAGKSLVRIKELSKIAKYSDKELTELDVFIIMFNSFTQSRRSTAPQQDDGQKIVSGKTGGAEEAADLQLAALGTIADIMPLVDENRIIVRKGLEALKAKPGPGLAELLYKLDLMGRRYNTKDISWKLCPVINAARRMGHPEKAAALFFEKDPAVRESLAKELIDMNEERKSMEEEVWTVAEPQAYKSFSDYDEKLVLAYGEKINRGVTGLIAQRLTRRFNVPALAVSVNESTCTGSLRSARGYNVCALLEQCDDLFIDSGGHEFAAGFTLEKSNWELFMERLKTVAPVIEFAENTDEKTIPVDAELPASYITPDIFKTVDLFEPYGKENDQLTFLARNLTVKEINFVGRTESKHLKMTLDTGKNKWPALYWDAAERVINHEFTLEDKVDLVFSFTRDWFREMDTPQIIVTDLRKSN
ncbi:MAG: single-stranded-DNA-specific exonuclease RecJ [Treponema sp.]|nr:single-stranded-DNA-specific exonuclease RecJ [Treponema sp.]